MILFFLIHLSVTVGIPVLGVWVFLSHRRRTANQLFLGCSIAFSMYLGCLAIAFTSLNSEVVAGCVRGASIVALFVVFFFHCLRRSFRDPKSSFGSIIGVEKIWLVASVAVGIMCATEFYLKTVLLTPDIPIPRTNEPVYGPGLPFFGGFLLVSLIRLVYGLIRDVRRSEGIQRVEIEFTLLAFALALFVGTTTTVIVPLLTGSSRSALFSPVAAVLFLGVIAYGIATKRILEVGYILRMLAAYGVLVVYLAGIYAVTWLAVHYMLAFWFPDQLLVPHIVAAVAVAVSVAPAHGWMQRFARRLFLSFGTTDVSATVNRAWAVLRSIGTIDELCARISRVLSEAVGTDKIIILLSDGNVLKQVFPPPEQESLLILPEDEPLVRWCAKHQRPIITDMIPRMAPTEELQEAHASLRASEIAAAVPIRAKGTLQGLILLGRRLSGRVYGAFEQNALQLVADQLAVAIENAKLYTEVQEGKIYNDILLDSLVSGVIAVDDQGKITTANREAQRITGRRLSELVEHGMDILPGGLHDCLARTLASGRGVRNTDIEIEQGRDGRIPLQLGSSVFRGQKGRVLGALIVFNDLTAVKRLESQLRRTAHLASLGTLSAGMAHEIKNPLVALKTFSQLLPDRYDDPEFRETFSDLVGREVGRIDKIVNQLLQFGKPVEEEFKSISIHGLLRQSLQLVEAQRDQKNISLHTRWGAANDTVVGDPAQLESAFVNFFLNAVDAMDEGGSLTVETSEVSGEVEDDRLGLGGEDMGEQRIRVVVQDTGSGIEETDIAHIFDPFFSRKDTGTGMGLSVAHTIIRDHHGVIDVQSTVGKGTTFIVTLPLKEKETSAEDDGEE